MKLALGTLLVLASPAPLLAQDGPWTVGVPAVPSSPPPSANPIQSATPVVAAQPEIPTSFPVFRFSAVPTNPAQLLSGAPDRAIGVGVSAGPDIGTLNLPPTEARDALIAFRISCNSLNRREDLSGLTRPGDWQAACDAAADWSESSAISFFATQLEAVQIGDGNAFATGYFEPEIAASPTRQPGYDTPIYARPEDLIDVDLGQFSPEWKGKRIRGRLSGTNLVQYADRREIENGALAGRGLELAWAADPAELFFMQVQGSGRLRMPDGSILRLGYASQNGRDYTGIGKLLRDRGLLAPGQASMQGIVAWLRANPAEGRELMQENQSYVFFQPLTGPGPLGSMGHPVTERTSVAADPRFIPLGAPVWLNMEHDIADGLWVAQDTGGAIKGANRIDTFWGAGEEAARIAGGMSSRGQALVFVPRGTLNRLRMAATAQQ